ncbi:2291_t:CDS:2, partial [Dentiscutata heterogama]
IGKIGDDNEVDKESSEIETNDDETEEIKSLTDEELEQVFSSLSQRPLIDVIKENSTNDKILEEESLEFKNLDREHGLYFLNFTSAMLYIW